MGLSTPQALYKVQYIAARAQSDAQGSSTETGYRANDARGGEAPERLTPAKDLVGSHAVYVSQPAAVASLIEKAAPGVAAKAD
jgi:hypothetical protein